ncbi:maltokinase N-terminal cap-like domain-containing protein [Streptacidiphilus cavernicola]|uniref:Maltokinase n=1 Tax=Streptacidiphilus cavernicola TaxID=3342716 RepID=A0ABV6VRD6_9ACTN
MSTAATAEATGTVGCACLAAANGEAAQADRLLRPLLPALTPWLVGRRWFTHEHGCMTELAPVTGSVLRQDGDEGDAAVLVHLLVEARYPAAAARRYQLLLGLRQTLPPVLGPAAVGAALGDPWDGWQLYEATADPELMSLLLDRTAAGESTRSLLLSTTSAQPLPSGLAPRALAVEQSNSTVVYGDRLLLKVFRQPEPGPHPETEVLSALTRLGSTRTPHLAGWLHTPGTGRGSTVLGILEDFLPADGDGWELAVRQAVDCLSDDRRGASVIEGFTHDSHTLGRAVAEVHRALADAFPTVRLKAQQIIDTVADMDRRLAAATAAVPAMEAYGSRISAVYDDFAQAALQGRGLDGQRVHGDLHLGQVLRGRDGWKVIDFEGEPARPIGERGLPQSPLRDVAGMLRSFDYAAQHALFELRSPGAEAKGADAVAERLRQERRARAWTVRNRRAFCDGYAEAGDTDPRVHPIAMRAFETDKAVYEALYEAAHRPAWLPVPMAAIRRTVGSREASTAVPARGGHRSAGGTAGPAAEAPGR